MLQLEILDFAFWWVQRLHHIGDGSLFFYSLCTELFPQAGNFALCFLLHFSQLVSILFSQFLRLLCQLLFLGVFDFLELFVLFFLLRFQFGFKIVRLLPHFSLKCLHSMPPLGFLCRNSILSLLLFATQFCQLLVDSLIVTFSGHNL